MMKKMKDKQNQETKEVEKEENKEKKEPTLEEQIALLKEEVDNWKNKYYMAYADTQNLKKNLEKEHQQFIRYRSMGFVEKLLPALDCFYSVMQNEPEDPVLKNYLVGFRYIYNMLTDALKDEGVTEIEPKVNDKFDFNLMEAVEAVDGEKDDVIVEVRRKGYKLHDRIIKHAQVVVSKVPTKEEPKQEETKEENVSVKKDA